MMYKQNTYRIFSIAMAIWLMVVSMGFTASEHYCQGVLKHLTWFGEASPCHEMAVKNSCHSSDATSLCKKGSCNSKEKGEKPCCENETVFFQLDADYLQFTSTAKTSYKDLDQGLAYHIFELAASQPFKLKSNFNLYKPPILKFEHRVFTQSFLL